MKAILMSIKPQWVAKILNGEKTIEIRKKFPKDYVGWVYIYCTKNKKYIYREFNGKYFKLICSTNTLKQEIEDNSTINGQVIARFWCDKVEEIEKSKYNLCYTSESLIEMNLLKHSCLSFKELHDYLQGKNGYAIHITKLEIPDKPKEISEFYGAFTQKRYEHIFGNNAVEIDKKYGGLRQPTKSGYEYTYPLTRAPESYCYIEIE